MASRENEAEHLGQATGRLALREVEEVSRKADDITAAVAGGEVRPAAREEVDLKGATGSVGALGIGSRACAAGGMPS